MTNEEKVQHWVDLSDYDIATAEDLMIPKRYLYVGFMCHQAVEKLLKAYFRKLKDETPPYTHNLISLAEKTGIFDEMSEQQQLFIDKINTLNIEARYQDYKKKLSKELTSEVTQEILTKTKELLSWIKLKI